MGHKRLTRVTTDVNVTKDVFHRESWNEDEFRQIVEGHGITESWAISLLINKYVHGLSNYQLVAEEGFTSEKTVRRLLKQLHVRLERCGFKPRRSK